jgi:hypothetical protein
MASPDQVTDGPAAAIAAGSGAAAGATNVVSVAYAAKPKASTHAIEHKKRIKPPLKNGDEDVTGERINVFLQYVKDKKI